MKNIALCFDDAVRGSVQGLVTGRRRDGATTDEAPSSVVSIAGLLRADDHQVVWSPTVRWGARRRHLDHARAMIAEGCDFLAEEYQPGDRLFLFGAGRGAACARALARLLGAVGVLGAEPPGWADDFRDYVLATYALPRSPRDSADWDDIARLATEISGGRTAGIAVHFAGLWDCVPLPGTPPCDAADGLPGVLSARHAVAIDELAGGHGAALLGSCRDAVTDVWFRGEHADLTGAPGGCPELSRIAFDWVLDGAIAAGAVVDPESQRCPALPADALSGSAHAVSWRRVPDGALVHASVQAYVRAHPWYWRRLPAQLAWVDADWAARAERLVAPETCAASPTAPEMPALAPV